LSNDKRILIAGSFLKDDRISHGKEAYFERLIDYMSKYHGIFFDIKDVAGLPVIFSSFKRIIMGKPHVKLSIPPGCTHSYLGGNTGLYLGFPNFQCIFSKIDRNICFNIARRQSLYSSRMKLPKFLIKFRYLVFFLSAGIALKRITNELLRLNLSLIICFNRETPINALLRITAKKLSIPILFVEGGILPGTIEFDSVGNEALSWPVRHLNKFKQLKVNEEDRNRAIKFISFLKNNKISRKAQLSDGVDEFIVKKSIDRPLIFFAGSNERGTGIYLKEGKEFKQYSPFFSGNEDAIFSLLELAEKHDWFIIFKPHPNETDYGKIYNIKNPRLYVERHANIFDLIDISNVTITITSGISGISLIHGKPSILLGKNGLFGKGATYDLDNKENLSTLVEKAIVDGFTKNMQKRWLEYAARTIKYYNFSFGTDIEEYIGRGVEEAAQLLLDFLDEKIRTNMFI
jgi:hypothetical protein